MPLSDILLFAVDPALGRFDSGLLSNETMLSLVFQELDPAYVDSIRQAGEENLSFTELSRVQELLTYDSKEALMHIDMTSYSERFDGPLEGTLRLEFLPKSVKHCLISDNSNLQGSLETTMIPQSMQVLNVSRNSFSGERAPTMDLSALINST